METAVRNNDRDDVIEIDLQELIGLVLHWLWLILGCGIVTAATGFLICFLLITPQYESTTRVYILNSNEKNNLTYSDTQLATQLTKDYEELITSRYVLEQVIEKYGLQSSYGGLKSKVTVSNLSGTRIIDITVKDESPIVAQTLADAIRDISSAQITSVMNIEAVNVVDMANLPTSPSEPSVVKWTAIGFMVGFFLCAAVIIIRFLLDDTIKSSEDIENYLGLSTLALIPDANLEDKKKKSKKSSSHKSSSESSSRTTTERGSDSHAGPSEEDIADLEEA